MSGQEKSAKTETVQLSNLLAARAVADSVRTSLGPRGMDKMISGKGGDVTITNDGATILENMKVSHPCAQMLKDLSKAQDVEAGDGTTSVVVLAGALVMASHQLLTRGFHPSHISRAFGRAIEEAEKILLRMAIPIDLTNRDVLLQNAVTSLSSKMVSANSPLLAQMAVDSVLRVIDPATATSVDLRNIHVVKRLGGAVEDCELVDGLVFAQKSEHTAQGPSRIENARIGLIQFCISPPKTDMECNVVVRDWQQVDRALKQERQYILNICKAIAATGCNVLLIQKSILRDAVNDLALHFLAKMKIMVIKDVEREDVDFICRTLGCLPVASVDALHASKLAAASLVEEVSTATGKYVKVTGIQQPGKTVTILVRGPNKLILDETERSIHDALCVVRSLVKRKFLLPGGSAPEVEVSQGLAAFARTLSGIDQFAVRAFAEALEVIPITLAENAGLNPIATVTELRNRHARGERAVGINVKKMAVSDMVEANVVQPLLVSLSALTLATECVRQILKIDDIVPTR